MMKRLSLLTLLLILLIPVDIHAQDAECEDGFRLFDHEYLAGDPVCIPEAPERIIALDEGIMVDLIALGTPPIGVHDWGNRDFTPYIDTSEVASVGTPSGPNYEAMLELEPDLIIGRAEQIAWFGDNALENLQSIAPIVLSDSGSSSWEDGLLLHGAVLNQEEVAQDMLSTYEMRLIEFQEATEDEDDITIAIIRSRADAFNVYASNYFITELVQAAGLTFPEAFDDLEQRNSISLEQIDILESDYLFVLARNEDEAAYLDQATEGALWQFLPAVQQEQVYQVDWSTWVAGWNIVGANLVIDALYEYFTDVEPETPNPFTDILTEEYQDDDTDEDTDE